MYVPTMPIFISVDHVADWVQKGGSVNDLVASTHVKVLENADGMHFVRAWLQLQAGERTAQHDAEILKAAQLSAEAARRSAEAADRSAAIAANADRRAVFAIAVALLAALLTAWPYVARLWE